MPDVGHLGWPVTRKWKWMLTLVVCGFGPKVLARTCNGEALVVQKFLDTQKDFNVLTPVHPLPCAALDRLQLRKFGLPEAQDVSRQAAEAGNFADAEVKLVGNYDFAALPYSSCSLFLCTHRDIQERG